MRFSTSLAAIHTTLPLAAAGILENEDSVALRTMGSAGPSAAPPWPADAPPDDLDQRVRQIGEW